MRVAIDKAGRVVIPREVRAKAGLKPGVALEIRVRDGVIELEVPSTPMKIVKKGRWAVAVPDKAAGKLSQRQVDETVEALRGGEL